ncbi:MAG: SRPBCC family protein [Jiangellaceae bacterium]
MSERPRTLGKIAALAAAGAALAGGCVGLVTGALAPDLGLGRRTRRLGPQTLEIDAPRDLVFELIGAPYQERQPRAFADKVRVLERGADMVLAAHRTPVRGRLVATTVETVRLSRPDRVDFRLVRGPVPYVVERFTLDAEGGATTVTYDGDLGTDLWGLGQRWGDLVADRWEQAVATSLAAVKVEAERRAARPAPDRET